MREFEVLSESANETRFLGKRVGERLRGGEIFLLSGPLGVGKTTFVQGIAAGLGIEGKVKSPSFVLERIYEGRLRLRHCDFYRLSEGEINEAGLLDDPDGETVTVIEWAERAGTYPSFTVRVAFAFVPGSLDKRLMRLTVSSDEWGEIIGDILSERSDPSGPGN